MSRLALLLGVLLGLQYYGLVAGSPVSSADYPEQQQQQQQQQQERGLEYVQLKRGLLALSAAELLDSRERRSSSSGGNLGSSFIRYGRNGDDLGLSQPHTRSDVIIRYGRDGLNGRLNRLRQERMRRLARLALICAAKSQEEGPANSAEEKILREICKDAPLHPTVPDFV
ncbi:uncharacterized protein LOC100679849 [Nasonia vitripennis]|uniref:Uncharacterized protein n=1 Tax=Nasonia vitripennis TaxID=7425 RepID=A0A7M7GLY4_NASVI|nr:uncharacterized protein LOC100679849 [Nasonia vitripennis]